ncbi:MAG: hypothetical protein JXR42_02765 [Gammaproteobacteria bacterium]|nr:hypothetical protein [Gammaproteobacteria bacterium]
MSTQYTHTEHDRVVELLSKAEALLSTGIRTLEQADKNAHGPALFADAGSKYAGNVAALDKARGAERMLKDSMRPEPKQSAPAAEEVLGDSDIFAS